MQGDRPPHSHGNAVVFKSKHLAEAAHVNPGLTGRFRIGIFQGFLHVGVAPCPVRQASAAVIGTVIALYEDVFPHVLQTVSDFSLNAYIRYFSESIVCLPGTVSVQGVSVGVSIFHHYQYFKINLVRERAHPFFLLVLC